MTETAGVLQVGSLFAGLGGIELGLSAVLDVETVWQVEIEPFCRRVLAARWPDAERFDDVCEVSLDDLDPVDLICGGFPCTDLSVAGTHKGLAGDGSGLWAEFGRIIDELRPTFVLIENVPPLLTGDKEISGYACTCGTFTPHVSAFGSRLVCPTCRGPLGGARTELVRGAWLGVVLGDLHACGYDAEWDCVPAAAVGAPHLRDRTFVLGWRRDRASTDPDGGAVRVRPQRCAGGHKGQLQGSEEALARDARGPRLAADANGGRREELGVEDGQPGHRSSPGSLADGRDRAGQDAADADSAGRQEQHLPVLADGEGLRRRRDHEGRGWGGLPETVHRSWGVSPPPVRRMDDGPAPGVDGPRQHRRPALDRARLKALGNAVVPSVAEVPARRILELLS